MAYTLDFQKAAVGVPGDVARMPQIANVLADAEVACVLDCRLGPRRPIQLEVLLDVSTFIADVDAGMNTRGDDAGRESPRRGLCDPTLEEQLHAFGATRIDILADDRLEELASPKRMLEHLCPRKFELPYGQSMLIARGTVG